MKPSAKKIKLIFFAILFTYRENTYLSNGKCECQAKQSTNCLNFRHFLTCCTCRVKMSEKTTLAKKRPLTKAQRNKNYFEKLRTDPQRYDEAKKKQTEAQKKYRLKKKDDEESMSKIQRENVIKKRREADRERARKYRERLKIKQNAQSSKSGSKSLNDIVHKSYHCPQTLGKAAKKVSHALPASPRKKKAVLLHMFTKLDNAEKNDLVKVIVSSPVPKKRVSTEAMDEINRSVQSFLERDDISQVSPKARDCKTYSCPTTGNKIVLPTRYMVLSMKEAYALFIDKRNKGSQGTCSLAHFKRQRPPNIQLINNLPHNMCMCSYHSNFIEAVAALHKSVPSVPDYNNGFVGLILCEISSMNCWLSKCNECSGISIVKLRSFVGESSLNLNVSWKVWKKSLQHKRVERHEQIGTLSDLIAHIAALSPQFLRHCYVKREQSEIFNSYDRPRAVNAEYGDEGLLQIDFAENFVCASQDEVQSAHWNQRQLTLFTSAFHYNEVFQSRVIVSNNLTHTKETIVPYLNKIISTLPNTLKTLKIWSDGPSSQFKNKYIAAIIPIFESKYNIKILWNYFATSHGKGCVDGIGATAKTVVRKPIRARACLVNNAADFVEAFHRTESTIIVEEVNDYEIAETNIKLKTDAIFSSAKDVRNISCAHHIHFTDNKIFTYETSKLGYNLKL